MGSVSFGNGLPQLITLMASLVPGPDQPSIGREKQ